jgi:hypothetical protein
MARTSRGGGSLLVALATGASIGYVDSRPGWDDTGVTALAVLVVSGALAFWEPRFAWCSALLVGGFIPLIEGRGGNDGSILALVVAAVGSAVGYFAARAEPRAADLG